jgi:hypothetical protein
MLYNCYELQFPFLKCISFYKCNKIDQEIENQFYVFVNITSISGRIHNKKVLETPQPEPLLLCFLKNECNEVLIKESISFLLVNLILEEKA